MSPADPGAGPIARRFVDVFAGPRGARRSSTSTTSSLGAIARLEADPAVLARWRGRCAHLLVDEVQDVDRAQLRLALLLAAPANRILLVGDDDQSIYGWRLADVRRVLGLDALLDGPATGRPRGQLPVPGAGRGARRPARRPQPGAVREADPGRAGAPRAGWSWRPTATTTRSGSSGSCGRWPDDGSTQAVLARTNRELIPAVVVALALGRPFRAPRLALPLEDPALDDAAGRGRAGMSRAGRPLLVALGAVRDRRRATAGARGISRSRPRCWRGPPATATFDAFRDAVLDGRRRLADLRRDDAALTLATAHATKGLEFDHVVVLGMDAARFPSARAVAEAADPGARLRGGAAPRLRRVDPGAALADAALRPGRARRRSCSRRSAPRSSASRSARGPGAPPG